MAIPVAIKDMKFKYICKYCQKGGLAWKVIDHKWMLFDTAEASHVCQEKKNVIDGQVSNLKKKKVSKKQIEKDYKKAISPFKEKFDKLTASEKTKAAKDIVKKIKDGDNALKAMADNPILIHKGNDEPKGVMGHSPATPANPIEAMDELFDEVESDIKKTNPKSSKKKVKLIDASELYQPVFGSSQSSTYYVVALYEGLKFAARVKGGGQTRTISIRVEGKAYNQLKSISGLQKFKDNGHYGSIHLNVETVYETKMVICGLIGGIDMEALTPIPDLTNIST